MTQCVETPHLVLGAQMHKVCLQQLLCHGGELHTCMTLRGSNMHAQAAVLFCMWCGVPQQHVPPWCVFSICALLINIENNVWLWRCEEHGIHLCGCVECAGGVKQYVVGSYVYTVIPCSPQSVWVGA